MKHLSNGKSEHNLDVIKTADWVIDLGPEGGDGGGRIIAEGSPKDIAKNKNSVTGKYLQKLLIPAHFDKLNANGLQT